MKANERRLFVHARPDLEQAKLDGVEIGRLPARVLQADVLQACIST